MEWSEYISQIIASENDFGKMTISLDEDRTQYVIPPIIQTSITMLDKMMENQGKLNAFVFPEKIQTVLIFSLMKLFHNIASGRIRGNYDPSGFSPDEKLKVGNAIVQYLGIQQINGTAYLSIKLADADSFSVPLSNCPIFQKVSTKRPLSKLSQYRDAKKKALEALNVTSSENEKLAYVASMKTHMSSSIFAMTTVMGAKEQLTDFRVDGKKVTDVFYIGQVDYRGNICNIGSGQMSGIPAIVFASDLYAIMAAVDKGRPIQSVIIDGSNGNALVDQLDALDQLLQINVPIVCITDVANSFELSYLKDRGFNIWRWDKESITPLLYNETSLSLNRRIKNCALHSVDFLKDDGGDISTAMKLLAGLRKEVENESPQMMKVYDHLSKLTFSILRSTIPLTSIDVDLAQKSLDDCRNVIVKEKHYMSETGLCVYKTIIDSLGRVYEVGNELKKVKILREYLEKHGADDIILVIPENSPKEQVKTYWNTWCFGHHIKGRMVVLFPSEYYAWPMMKRNVTIVCGWLKRAIMRKIIYGYNTMYYVILLYDYENKWKNYDINKWNKAFESSENKKIIERSFSTEKQTVSTVQYNVPKVQSEGNKLDDELGEIELILRENKYRQFVNGSRHAGDESVAAVPVSFVGGYLSFYRTGHKVISATKIILSNADAIDARFPSELKEGDFIVVKESDKDIVRELADVILKASGMDDRRSIATKWREALEIELLFCTVEDLCKKIKLAGCDKGIATIKNWIEDDEVIAPRSKNDLQIIAKVTGNETLLELLDNIFEAAQDVRNAHVLAGRKLSEMLKVTLAQELKKHESIDPFNFWEPIDMNIEGIGSVKVLKIIDIGTEVWVNSADTNRLIEE